MENTEENIFEYINSKFIDIKIERGNLYIVSTPIGAFNDISFRALWILKNVDLIASEDTRVTGNLLSHFGIRNNLLSYYSQTEISKNEYIVSELKSGKAIALVSDAGTPCISDPGNILVARCIDENISVIAIPGASSVIHSLVVSGLPANNFYFQGFFPQKKGREKTFLELKNIKQIIVIFESKYRIKKTLSDCKKHFGNKYAVAGRELTKKFEEIYRFRLNDNELNLVKEKGEFVILINNI